TTRRDRGRLVRAELDSREGAREAMIRMPASPMHEPPPPPPRSRPRLVALDSSTRTTSTRMKNRLVAQAFQPAGSADFRVRWTTNGRLESRPNPQARKPAPRTSRGPSSHCAPKLAWCFSCLLVFLLFFRSNLVRADE